ncbi:MAG: hypothetical protein ABF285_02845 [Pacificibacter sp.]
MPDALDITRVSANQNFGEIFVYRIGDVLSQAEIITKIAKSLYAAVGFAADKHTFFMGIFVVAPKKVAGQRDGKCFGFYR